MRMFKQVLGNIQIVPCLFAAVATFGTVEACAAPAASTAQEDAQKYVFHGAGNPYLPLWEHVPDGEPRVFEDPDNPGKYRAYIIGSHDLRMNSYCGPDIRFSLIISTTSGT